MPYRILLVEDDGIVLFAIADFLRLGGFTVATAATVDEARRAITADTYDLMLTDLHLANMQTADGLDLAALAIRTGRAGHVVILTAYGTDQTVMRAAKLGVDAVLKKPMPLPELVVLINRLCNPHHVEA